MCFLMFFGFFRLFHSLVSAEDRYVQLPTCAGDLGSSRRTPAGFPPAFQRHNLYYLQLSFFKSFLVLLLFFCFFFIHHFFSFGQLLHASFDLDLPHTRAKVPRVPREEGTESRGNPAEREHKGGAYVQNQLGL